MLRFTCPVCHATVDGNSPGDKLPCPGCGQRLQVPRPPANQTVLGELQPAQAIPAIPAGPATVEDLPAVVMIPEPKARCYDCRYKFPVSQLVRYEVEASRTAGGFTVAGHGGTDYGSMSATTYMTVDMCRDCVERRRRQAAADMKAAAIWTVIGFGIAAAVLSPIFLFAWLAGALH